MPELCETTARNLEKLAARLEKLELFVKLPKAVELKEKEQRLRENQMKSEIETLKYQLSTEKQRTAILTRKLEEQAPPKELEELKKQLEHYKSEVARLDDLICLKKISEEQDERTIDELRAQLAELDGVARPLCEGCENVFSETFLDRTPRILRCGHTLCQECIQDIVGGTDEVQCPIDKETTLLGTGGVEYLPLNYAIMKLL